MLSAEHDAHAAHSDNVQDDVAPEFPAEPFGAGYPTYGALAMQRYMHDSGSSRAQL